MSTETVPTETADPAKSATAEVLDLIKTVAIALGIALVLRTLLFQPFTIPSESMEPGLLKGDYLVVSKLDYGLSRFSLPLGLPLFHGRLFNRQANRGDVVVFKLPRDTKIDYIKRVIGLPGDRVQVKGGTVYVNGKAIPRTPMGLTEDPGDIGLTLMRERETRADGKPYTTFDRGPGHEGDDTGVYVVPQGYYFMMGDNRDNSLDSRWPKELGVGFVPAENLVGRARFVLASWTDGASLFKPWTWLTRFNPHRLLKPIN
jgi:signal peptidase I